MRALAITILGLVACFEAHASVITLDVNADQSWVELDVTIAGQAFPTTPDVLRYSVSGSQQVLVAGSDDALTRIQFLAVDRLEVDSVVFTINGPSDVPISILSPTANIGSDLRNPVISGSVSTFDLGGASVVLYGEAIVNDVGGFYLQEATFYFLPGELLIAEVAGSDLTMTIPFNFQGGFYPVIDIGFTGQVVLTGTYQAESPEPMPPTEPDPPVPPPHPNPGPAVPEPSGVVLFVAGLGILRVALRARI